MSNVIPFPLNDYPRGEGLIYPCMIDGGCWAVEHMSRSGDSAALLGTFFSYDEAERAAREWAQSMGATFVGGVVI